MKRRTFLGLSLGALAAACGGATSPEEAGGGDGQRATGPGGPGGRLRDKLGGSRDASAAIEAASKFALSSEIPGFQVIGSLTSGGTAPVLVQLRLNINDFMRADREAAAVMAWLDDLARYDLAQTELSFTGHVLQAFVDGAPDLIARIQKDRPTILEHYRALKARKKQSTEAELYYTEPSTMEIDRSRYGPLVLIQKTFGVTPISEGGTPGELLRSVWTKAKGQQDLEAMGYDQLDRNQQIGHPDRIIGWCLPDIEGYGGSEQIESFMRIRRLEAAVSAGRDFDSSDLEARLDDLKRWAQVAREMGFDISAVEGLGDVLGIDRIPTFSVGVMGIHANDAEVDAMKRMASSNRAGLVATMQKAMEGLAARTTTLPTMADELALKLSRLDPKKVYATRFAWHGSNDYSLQPWADLMWGERGTFPYPLTPADVRPQKERDAIVAARVAILQTLGGDQRVQAASLENSTQWAEGNSPEVGYPQVLGVAFKDVPGALDPDRIDALAASKGLSASYESSAGKGAKSGGGGGVGGRGSGSKTDGGGRGSGSGSTGGGRSGAKPGGSGGSGGGKGGKWPQKGG